MECNLRYCTYCGKEIADVAVICLGCGCQTIPKAHFTGEKQENVIVQDCEPTLATWSKICGIVSFFIGWFALGITAIILASLSKDETNGIMCPSAKVGYVCGIVSTVLSFLLFVFIIAFMTSLYI